VAMVNSRLIAQACYQLESIVASAIGFTFINQPIDK
jgi:hypothetical protein